MKATDYYEKYKENLLTQEGAVNLIKDMSNEVKELSKTRNAKYDDAVRSVIKEVNQKWNKIARLLEKETGKSALVHNGFLNFWKTQIPNL